MSDVITGEAIGAAMSAASASAETTASPPSTAAAGVLPAADAAATGQAARDGQAAPATAATDQSKPATEKPAGPIPFDVHKTALENARTKAFDEVRAQYQWAEKIPEQHRATVAEAFALVDTDPTQLLDIVVRTAMGDPAHQGQLRSWFGKMLSGNRPMPQAQPNAPATQDSPPEPDFYSEDDKGTRTPFYSASQFKAAIAHEVRALRAELEKEYGPLRQDFQSRQQAQAAQQRQQAIDDYANQVYARVSKYPHFKEHEQAIGAAMAADDTLDVFDAYVRVVLPKLDQSARHAVVAQMQDKANAATPNPTTGAMSALPPPKNFQEAFARLPASTWR